MLAVLGLLLCAAFPWAAVAQDIPTPSSTSICDLPEFKGTAEYNQYCTGNGSTYVAPQPAPVDPNRTWVIEHVSYTGEFYVITRDGRKLVGQNAALVSIDNGARAITGPTGHAVLTLPDGSTFTIGPNTEITLDTFVYEPGSNVRKVTMTFIKGFFRWVTGMVRPVYKPSVNLPVGDLSFRGTDVECVVEPGGSGYIKLNSGELDLTDYDTGQVRVITAGQTVRFENFKIVS